METRLTGSIDFPSQGAEAQQQAVGDRNQELCWGIALTQNQGP